MYFEIQRLSSTRCNVKDYVRKINPIDDYNISLYIYISYDKKPLSTI